MFYAIKLMNVSYNLVMQNRVKYFIAVCFINVVAQSAYSFQNGVVYCLSYPKNMNGTDSICGLCDYIYKDGYSPEPDVKVGNETPFTDFVSPVVLEMVNFLFTYSLSTDGVDATGNSNDRAFFNQYFTLGSCVHAEKRMAYHMGRQGYQNPHGITAIAFLGGAVLMGQIVVPEVNKEHQHYSSELNYHLFKGFSNELSLQIKELSDQNLGLKSQYHVIDGMPVYISMIGADALSKFSPVICGRLTPVFKAVLGNTKSTGFFFLKGNVQSDIHQTLQFMGIDDQNQILSEGLTVVVFLVTGIGVAMVKPNWGVPVHTLFVEFFLRLVSYATADAFRKSVALVTGETAWTDLIMMFINRGCSNRLLGAEKLYEKSTVVFTLLHQLRLGFAIKSGYNGMGFVYQLLKPYEAVIEQCFLEFGQRFQQIGWDPSSPPLFYWPND